MSDFAIGTLIIGALCVVVQSGLLGWSVGQAYFGCMPSDRKRGERDAIFYFSSILAMLALMAAIVLID